MTLHPDPGASMRPLTHTGARVPPMFTSDFDPREPHTAISDGYGPAWCDLEDVGDLASLDLARQRYLRRQAMDAVDHLIALLDALDVEHEDMEEDDHDGDGFYGSADQEPSLGATGHVDQCHAWARGADALYGNADLEHDTADAEPMLGAPERHPHAWTMTDPYYEPANGSRRQVKGDGSQGHWSAGRNADGANDGEAEPGYDLPEGDDERCGSDDVDGEPSLGANACINQERWSRGGTNDAELVNEDGSDDEDAHRIGCTESAVNAAAARDALRQARAIHARKSAVPAARDPDELVPVDIESIFGNLRAMTFADCVR